MNTAIHTARRVKAGGRAALVNTRLRHLREINARSRRPITGDSPVVVSMTTHGRRIGDVFYPIECIARGNTRPARFLLWLDDPNLMNALPEPVQRLQSRGLEVLLTENYGPHTKYFPYVSSQERHVLPLVTADDDIIYPPDFLDALLAAPTRDDEVLCHRARTIAISDGRLAPYTQWKFTDHDHPTVLNFATGVGGVRYPPGLLDLLRDAGTGFGACCPRADDVWLHVMSIRNGYRPRQIWPKAREDRTVPGTRASALWPENLGEGGNDAAIAATYTQADIAVLMDEHTKSVN